LPINSIETQLKNIEQKIENIDTLRDQVNRYFKEKSEDQESKKNKHKYSMNGNGSKNENESITNDYHYIKSHIKEIYRIITERSKDSMFKNSKSMFEESEGRNCPKNQESRNFPNVSLKRIITQ